MKKIVSFSLMLVMILSLCACGVSLTEEQQAACDLADAEQLAICAQVLGFSYSSSIKKIDGHIVYIGRLKRQGGFDSSRAEDFGIIHQDLSQTLCPVGVHPVLYLGDKIRIVDNHLSGVDID